mmetsp:Transcript_26076/g.61936  ORF Transcript_26076/g.61936 Transcript_26076/m.61936 type:complete len:82 (-) Transcript_26076:215-460(-)
MAAARGHIGSADGDTDMDEGRIGWNDAAGSAVKLSVALTTLIDDGKMEYLGSEYLYSSSPKKSTNLKMVLEYSGCSSWQVF